MKGLFTLSSALLVGLSLLVPTPGTRAEEAHDHSHHRQMMKDATLKRSTGVYPIPDVGLIDQDGKKVELKAVLNSDKAVMLNFVFATCTTICPVLSAGFAEFRRRLGADAAKVQFVSITIDPEHDTAEVLKDYGTRFRADQGWVFLTGKRVDIDRVTKAFGAYVTNKMNHLPVTYMRAPGAETWVKVDGLMGGSDYANEYAKLMGK
jgi:protein SCO1/2